MAKGQITIIGMDQIGVSLAIAIKQQCLEWLVARPLAPWKDEDALPGPPHELKRMDPLSPGWGQKG